MAAVCGFKQGDLGIGEDLERRVSGGGGETDEGVIESVQDERGDGDAVENTRALAARK